MGAFALEAIGAQQRAIQGVLGQGGAAAAALVTPRSTRGGPVEERETTPDTVPLCRECERRVCRRCPVARGKRER